MWGRGFGRGFGRGWGLGGWGFGRGFGRGFGFGARLGYCPWTGLPRGWRWGYGYGYPYGYNYGNTAAYTSQYAFNPWRGAYGMYPAANPQDNLQSEAEFLRKRLDEITKRIEELEGK